MDGIEALWLTEPDQVAQAVRVAARAMRDDPDWVAIADDPMDRFELLSSTFAGSLSEARVAGVRQRDRILGVACAVGPGRCVGANMAPEFRSLAVPPPSASDAERLLYFRSVLADRDLDEPHWHVGPVAIEPGFQSMGMGRTVMSLLCDDFDQHGRISWVKTAKPENVTFYSQLGFELVDSSPMLTAHLWFLRRQPR